MEAEARGENMQDKDVYGIITFFNTNRARVLTDLPWHIAE